MEPGMDIKLSLRELMRRTNQNLAQVRENQRQLRVIHERYNQLGMAVDHLRSYLNLEGREEEEHEEPPRSGSGTRRRRPKKPEVPGCDETLVNVIHRQLPQETVHVLKNREYGLHTRCPNSSFNSFQNHTLPDYVSQALPAMLKEKELDLGSLNKVFASSWLNDSQVVFGTKCNRIMVMDVRTNDMVHIPSLKSSPQSVEALCPNGIHGLDINPSRTMLATGAVNTNDLAVYELPSFDALCVGEEAHSDWIFDLKWVDDEHIVTGSRDTTVAIWRVSDHLKTPLSAHHSNSLGHHIMKPTTVKMCEQAYRVRALALSRHKGLMGVLSMNGKFHLWDLQTFRQLESIEMSWRKENVCMASSEDLGLFAVGSQAYVALVDHRTNHNGTCPGLQLPVWNGERAIRSLSFNEKILTIGMGDGKLLFFDMKMYKFLCRENGELCELKISDGWLREDYNYHQHIIMGNYSNAIYTHCYDDSKGRLFVAGGPLAAGLYGNYAGLYY